MAPMWSRESGGWMTNDGGDIESYQGETVGAGRCGLDIPVASLEKTITA